jgi:hypothetical protein
MTITYEVITNAYGDTVKRTNADGIITWIPLDPANSDYQAYLAAQSTPIDTEDE